MHYIEQKFDCSQDFKEVISNKLPEKRIVDIKSENLAQAKIIGTKTKEEFPSL